MREAAGDAIPCISERLILDEIGAGVARLRQEFGPVDAVFGIAHRGGRPAFARSQPVLQMAVGDPAGEEVDDSKGRPVVSSPISESGRYEIPNLPVGQAEVAVQTFKPRPKPEPVMHPVTGEPVGDGSEATGGYVPIPGLYAAPQSSGLEYTLRPGEQTFDIVLGK